MSIIYDALQKTQRNREYLKISTHVPQVRRRHHHWRFMILGLFIMGISTFSGAMVSICLRSSGITALQLHHVHRSVVNSQIQPMVAQPSQERPVAPMTPAESDASPAAVLVNHQQSPVLLPTIVESQEQRTKWTLNGVLISGTEKIALINNQPYHLGDIIDGMKIVEIEMNTVKLQNGQHLVELHV